VTRVVPGAERALSLHMLDGAELQATTWGLRQPVRGTPSTAARSIDVALVPGLAFDRRGRRMGYGGGYSARPLAASDHWTTVGVSWDELVVEALPAGPLDQAVAWLLTPSGLRQVA